MDQSLAPEFYVHACVSEDSVNDERVRDGWSEPTIQILAFKCYIHTAVSKNSLNGDLLMILVVWTLIPKVSEPSTQMLSP